MKEGEKMKIVVRMGSVTGAMRLLVAVAWALTAGPVLAATDAADDDALWREKTGYNPQVHGSVPGSSDADLFARVPYAYYPYGNEIEVVFDAAAATKLLPKDARAPAAHPRELRLNVIAAAGGRVVASGTIPLDAKGRGAGIISLPPLAEGEYRVEYEFGGTKLAASKALRRTRFEFEGCSYGTEHRVYAPFIPVSVDGSKVSVVGRSCTVNALGLFDSVVSQGRELLAAPMQLIAETADGRRVRWSTGWFSGGVKGKVLYPDLAQFECEAKSAIGVLQSTVSIEEDGCARVRWTLSPARSPVTVRRMWLEMALKDSEAPLCHLVGMNSMRHNYAGSVPRGGQIHWINQAWRPARWEVEPFPGAAPPSYQVWEARNLMHWGSDVDSKWSFAPYIWLGAEERGLAWFADHTQGYSTDGKMSLQRLFIEPGKVVLRVELIQEPVTLDTPRIFEFGLQASPTKPLRPDWRGYDVPGGGGMPVVVWGGFGCHDKYPVDREWSLVDKIMEGRSTRKADEAWIDAFAKKHGVEDAKANGEPWLRIVRHFAGKEAGTPSGVGTTVYFEEHQTNGAYPEYATFIDEWGDLTFSRYRFFEYPKTWGPAVRSANPASYRDFAVYYANEWMKRGIGIYYDNTFPMVDRNREHFRERGLAWSNSIWGHREYYRRVWKRSRELMEKGLSPLPLHTVGHVTNCQVLPYTTWWDATLGVESPGPWIPDEKPPPDVTRKQVAELSFAILPGPAKDKTGRALPYPPDYLRAMEMGRMAGLIPHYRHALRGEDAFGGLGVGFGATSQGQDAAERAHRYLSDAGMGLVHEIRGGHVQDPAVMSLRRAFREFGYGKPEVTVWNYWDEKPFAAVGNPNVKWIAMTRDAVRPGPQTADRGAQPAEHRPPGAVPVPFGLMLLQSYAAEATSTSVRFPEGRRFVDAQTREPFVADQNGTVKVSLPADYGTRLLYVLRNPDEPQLLPNTRDSILVDDFELGLGFGVAFRGGGFTVAPDTRQPANHVLQIQPGHPSQNVLRPQLAAAVRDYELSFRVRLPELPAKAGACGLLSIGYREEGGRRYYFGLGIRRDADGTGQWTVGRPVLVLDGGKNEGYQTVLSSAACSSPLDSEWHSLTVRVQGRHHQLLFDGKAAFEGEDERNPGGGFSLAPGWGWDLPVKYVEVDDLQMRAIVAP